MTSLINGLDQIESTLGHQVAYLSKWAPRAYNDLVLRRPRLIPGDGTYRTSRLDAGKIPNRFDLAYFDPPYNTNNTHTPTTRVRYASYYHFWTTVVLNDKPESIGASNRRLDCSSDTLPGAISKYESTKYDVVLSEIEQLITNADARYVLFSYSNKGKVEIKDLEKIFSQHKILAVEKISHRENVQKLLTSNREWLGDQSANFEYLFLVEKRQCRLRSLKGDRLEVAVKKRTFVRTFSPVRPPKVSAPVFCSLTPSRCGLAACG